MYSIIAPHGIVTGPFSPSIGNRSRFENLRRPLGIMETDHDRDASQSATGAASSQLLGCIAMVTHRERIGRIEELLASRELLLAH